MNTPNVHQQSWFLKTFMQYKDLNDIDQKETLQIFCIL